MSATAEAIATPAPTGPVQHWLERRAAINRTAALLELYKHKGIPWQPADHGFVFSKEYVERYAERAMRLNQARHIEHVRFHLPPGQTNLSQVPAHLFFEALGQTNLSQTPAHPSFE